MQEESIKKCLTSLFSELSSSACFAESAAISGDFEVEDMPEVIMRGRNILLSDMDQELSEDNKRYEVQCLYELFWEMKSSYDFACECSEVMDIDTDSDSDDMYDITNYAIKKLSEFEATL